MGDRIGRAWDAVLVHYRAPSELEAAVRSLLHQEGPRLRRTTVVDNSGQHDLRLPQGVEVLRPGRNLGYARAVNLGLRRGDAPYVLLLNPDTRLESPFLEAARRAFEERPELAVIGPQVREADGRVQASARRDPGLLTALAGRTGLLTRLFPSNPLTRRDLVPTEEGPREVDWISGAAMALRRSAVEDVGGMDERFFLYWEDCDLCRRLRRKGYRVLYHPGLGPVVHIQGRSSRERPLFSLYHFLRSACILYSRYDRSPLKAGTALAFLGGAALLALLGAQRILKSGLVARGARPEARGYGRGPS